MENLTFWLVVVLATIAVYRLLSRRVVTPKARVTAMLRRYRALERTGLSEHECLLQLLATRRNWKGLPHRFLGELVSRLRSKEDVVRFVSVSEDYGYIAIIIPKSRRGSTWSAEKASYASLRSMASLRRNKDWNSGRME